MQLVGPADRVGDGVAVAAVGDRRSEVDRPLQRPEVVPERVGPARGPEPDRRRDPREQVVGGDQDAVLEQGQLPVGVARGGDDLPAVQAVAVVDELGVDDGPDERPEELALPEQLLGDLGRERRCARNQSARRLDHSSLSHVIADCSASSRPCTTRAPVRSRTSAVAPR